ncbi:MAG: cobyrinic acid a,c-diamide synthase [Clostridia bacterium]|nr:cobyrinic acid a,c-diamide synthase [Clostridia bacterium]
MENKGTVIAVSGKGGVGKTTISACVVRHLVENKPEARILAIDADPAVGLSVALGVEAEKTLDDIRKTIVHNVEAGQTREAIEMLGEARFRIFDAIVEQKGFAFLAIGRPESAGCYCKVNSYLKEVISLLASDFDYVVIDGEAGIEQINRRVMEKVSHLILITDLSRKGVQVVQTIKKVADELVMYDRVGAVVNRVSDPEYEKLIEIPGVEIMSFIGNDDAHAANDIRGKSVFELPPDSKVLCGASEALRKMDIL